MFQTLGQCDHLLAEQEVFLALQEQLLQQRLAEQVEQQLLELLEVLEVLVIWLKAQEVVEHQEPLGQMEPLEQAEPLEPLEQLPPLLLQVLAVREVELLLLLQKQ
jgi:hypothetical protein